MAISDREIIEAAYLAALGKTQEEIGRRLNREQSTVSRWLKRAFDKHYLIPARPLLNREVIPEGELIEASKKLGGFQVQRWCELEESLVAKYALRKVTIVQGYADEHAPTWQQRAHTLGAVAAARFESMLPRMKKVGVLWGRSLRAMVDCLDWQNPRNTRVEFYPLAGDPIFIDYSNRQYPHTVTASQIANELSQKVNGTEAALSLSPVPEFLPKKLGNGDTSQTQQKRQRQLLRTFFAEVPSYRAIFGKTIAPKNKPHPQGEIVNLDTIITSVGVVDSEDPWYASRFESDPLEMETWSRLIIGDMGGVLFPNSDEKVRDLNDRCTGANVFDFHRVAERARQSKQRRTGVVVLAHGKAKARPLVEAIQIGCVNEIIVEYELAEELAK